MLNHKDSSTHLGVVEKTQGTGIVRNCTISLLFPHPATRRSIMPFAAIIFRQGALLGKDWRCRKWDYDEPILAGEDVFCHHQIWGYIKNPRIIRSNHWFDEPLTKWNHAMVMWKYYRESPVVQKTGFSASRRGCFRVLTPSALWELFWSVLYFT